MGDLSRELAGFSQSVDITQVYGRLGGHVTVHKYVCTTLSESLTILCVASMYE